MKTPGAQRRFSHGRAGARARGAAAAGVSVDGVAVRACMIGRRFGMGSEAALRGAGESGFVSGWRAGSADARAWPRRPGHGSQRGLDVLVLLSTFSSSALTTSGGHRSNCRPPSPGSFRPPPFHSWRAFWPPRYSMGWSMKASFWASISDGRRRSRGKASICISLLVVRELMKSHAAALVLRLLLDAVEGAAPGAEGPAGQLRRAPLCPGLRRQPVVEVAGQPGAHHLRGDLVALEAPRPLVRPRADLAVDAGVARRLWRARRPLRKRALSMVGLPDLSEVDAPPSFRSERM